MGEGLGTSPGSLLLMLPAMQVPQPVLREAFNELPEGLKEEKQKRTFVQISERQVKKFKIVC